MTADSGALPSRARRGHAKRAGAYYTDRAVAAFLTRWAIRDRAAHVLDPSFGGGVFLEEAAQRIAELGGDAGTQVFGVELDPEAHASVAERLACGGSISPGNLLWEDFFDVEPEQLPRFDALIGNPPFVRPRRFAESDREAALRRAANHGVTLPRSASRWAPFVVHALEFVTAGGNLAMVLPMELGHAAYARPVLEHLTRSFASLTLLRFRVPLFPDVDQDTLLLLGEGKGKRFVSLGWKELDTAEDLEALEVPIRGRRTLRHHDLIAGRGRFSDTLIDARAHDLYQELAASSNVVRLGDIAQVGIGYVTGANGYFHLSPARAKELGLPPSVLHRSVFRGRAFSGLRFTDDDWERGTADGSAGFLLSVATGAELDEPTRAYLRAGERKKVHLGYKCRHRTPWYRVPITRHADAFLTYMSGKRSAFVANDAEVFAPNTLHVVTFHAAPGRPRPGQGPETGATRAAAATPAAGGVSPAATHAPTMSAVDVALAWRSSLVALSTELEGHVMGGGMLKLEPSEARRVMLPREPLPDANELAAEIEALVRVRGQGAEATALVRSLIDRHVLQGQMGLSEADCRLLQAAVESLRERRRVRVRAQAS